LIITENTNGNINNCSFYNNNCNSTGSSLYLNGNTTTITNSLFDSNQAGIEGATIYADTYFSIDRSVFRNNKNFNNEYSASVIDAANHLMVTNSLFENNTGISLGAINSYGDVVANNVTFKNNKSGTSAAGINIEGESATFTNSKFISNYGGSGGALSAESLSRQVVKIDKCTFESNYANIGGGFYFVFVNITVTNSNFTKNSAIQNGAFYVDENSVAKFSNSILANNIANKIDSTNGCGNNVSFINTTSSCSCQCSFVICDCSPTVTCCATSSKNLANVIVGSVIASIFGIGIISVLVYVAVKKYKNSKDLYGVNSTDEKQRLLLKN